LGCFESSLAIVLSGFNKDFARIYSERVKLHPHYMYLEIEYDAYDIKKNVCTEHDFELLLLQSPLEVIILNEDMEVFF
jgi:hypothetical protein